MMYRPSHAREEAEPMETDGVTRLLAAANDGDDKAAEQLFAIVYDELRVIAHAQRRRWSGDDTIGTTVLIHEAYLKLVRHDGDYAGRTHFYATASRAMRQVLINYAGRRKAGKRNLDRADIDVAQLAFADEQTLDSLLALDELLVRLEAEDKRRCRVVECRVFGGMSIAETADALGISPATVKRDWQLASAWLYRELKGDLQTD
jgi:RNA polymerase sigma factor (TIGR02999 family)